MTTFGLLVADKSPPHRAPDLPGGFALFRLRNLFSVFWAVMLSALGGTPIFGQDRTGVSADGGLLRTFTAPVRYEGGQNILQQSLDFENWKPSSEGRLESTLSPKGQWNHELTLDEMPREALFFRVVELPPLTGDQILWENHVLQVYRRDSVPGIPGNWSWAPLSLPPIETILSAPAPSRPVYGVYCWAQEYYDYHSFIRSVGWPNVRISGPMNDSAMRLLVQDEVELMLTVAARLHATFTPWDPFGDWRNRYDYSNDEDFIADFTQGTLRILQRYGPQGSFFADHPDLPYRPLRHVEIFNEPNFWYLDLPRDSHLEIEANQTPSEKRARDASRQALYGKLLTTAYAAIKRDFPEVNVVGFAAGGASSADVPFIKGVHEGNPQVTGSYDILSTHPYTTPVAPELVSHRSWGSYSLPGNFYEIRRIMAAHGTSSRPVWFTELNWSISQESGGFFPTNQQSIPAHLQAAYLLRGYAMALRLGVERLFYMSIVDTDGVNAGFLNRDRSERPSARALRQMLQIMPRPQLHQALCDGLDGVFIYTFDADYEAPGVQSVTLAWATESNGNFLPVLWGQMQTGAYTATGDHIELIEMEGQSHLLLREDGARAIELSPLPFFLRPDPTMPALGQNLPGRDF